MAAGIYELNIEQGTTWTQQFTYNSEGSPVDLTGYTARCQGRKDLSSSPVFDLTTENGGITLGGILGTVTLSIDTVTQPAQSGLWDLELISVAGDVTRFMQGIFTIKFNTTI